MSHSDEDEPSLPGWVDERLDEIFAGFPEDMPVEEVRQAYAECLAQALDSIDVPAAGATCRKLLLAQLEELQVEPEVIEALDEVLEALEEEMAEEE